MIRWYRYVFLIKTVYYRGGGLELLSAFLSLAVCYDSSVKRLRKLLMSMTFALSKSITWLLSHACFAMFEPFLCCSTFLMCSNFLVFKDLLFSYVIQSAIFTRILWTTLVLSLVGSLCFTDGNSCFRIHKGLLQTHILFPYGSSQGFCNSFDVL